MEWLKWGKLDYGASNKLLSSLGYITQVYVVALPLGVVFAKRYEQFWVSKGDSIIFKAKKKNTHTLRAPRGNGGGGGAGLQSPTPQSKHPII